MTVNLGDQIDVTILIVEDSPTQAEHLRHLLQGHGFKVTVATNGAEALKVLNHMTPTIVISDVVMPEMDGYELCREIKSRGATRQIPVMLLTNLSDPEDVIRGLECGADNFITKPYDNKFLISRINYILLNRNLRRFSSTDVAIEIFFGGRRHLITSDRIQILDLLLSTFESAIQKNRELEESNRELRRANEKIRKLEGLIPICAKCKKVRDDDGYWRQIEEYISENSDARFSHGFCPDCMKALYPDYWDKINR